MQIYNGHANYLNNILCNYLKLDKFLTPKIADGKVPKVLTTDIHFKT